MRTSKPCLVITTGDPAGIGPEIAVQALADGGQDDHNTILLGDVARLRWACQLYGLDLQFTEFSSAAELEANACSDSSGPIPVINPLGTAVTNVESGILDAACGEASWQYIRHAVDLCKTGLATAMVTCPINKQALHLAGHGSAGHTELLQELTGSAWSLTMFVTGKIRAVFLTRHMSLRKAIDSLTPDLVYETLLKFHSVCPSLGLDEPTIAVAALNPHAGEQGHFGNEEEEVLIPAIERANVGGLRVVGPVPADAVFYQTGRGDFDAILCLYHDQASAPLKAIDFHGTVSVTLGLPFLRYSVDHGTAFDIAGKGQADATNLRNVIAYAVQGIR